MDATAERIRVLHVDDTDFADAAATFLEGEAGFEVVSVGTAAEGRERLAADGIDCVVAEYDLPDGTGVEFLERVRESRPDLPFVMVTGAGSEELAGEAVAAGATGYLPKGDGADRFETLATRVRDAVTRARLERTRRSALELAAATDRGLALFTSDLEEVLFVNDAYEEIWRHSVPDLRADPTGFLDGVHPENRERMRERLADAAAGESAELEVRVDPGEHEERWVGVRCEPVTDDAGEVVRVAVFATDITDDWVRKRVLERQNQRLEEFAEVLTHDLRNPLTIATGFLEVIKTSPDEEAIEKCHNALTRMESLIDEVQTSVLQGRTEPEEVPVDLETIAREAWATTDTGDARLDVDGELRLRADPDQFRRLLENLFQNSAEHGVSDDDAGSDAAAGTGRADGSGSALTIRVVALDDGFAVDDDGAGLPADVAEDVFQRGFTTTDDGTGFGLSIVRNIAENHGWQVTAEESPAGGARFRFSQVLRSAESVIEMEAGGDDIWNRADQGHFYYESVEGDFDVRVNVPLVEHTHAWAKGGILVRTSTDTEAGHVMLRRRPNGATTVQWRPRDGLEARSLTSDLGRHQQVGAVGEPEADWLRLVRDGDTVRAYTSETGAEDDWHLLAELTESEILLDGELLLGIGGTSHNHVETTTLRFKHLQGVDPEHSVDIGDPIRSGSVRTIQPTTVEVCDPAAVSPSSMTLRGAVEAADGVDDLDVRFEYRPVMADEWTATDPLSVGQAGEARAEVTGLEPRQYYEYRLVADYGTATLESNAALVATPSGSPGATETGPRSSAHADPADGFADVAPWLDDDTPVLRVTEPTRDQLATALSVDGPRVVAFETSGTIDLEERDVTITNDRCWIAGQTAPSPGVTLIRGRLMVAADDCVVQHVRVRPGDAGLDEADGFIKEGIRTDDETENVVVDHCTSTWGVKENQSIGHQTDRTTFTNCLIAEGLRDSIHYKGERAFGTLVGDEAERVALFGNLWAHHHQWTPRLKDHTRVALSNNVRSHYDGGVEVEAAARATVEGDVFVRPTGGRPDLYGEGAVYAADNDYRSDDDRRRVAHGLRELPDRPCWPAGFERLPVDAVFEHVLTHAGARPADRTAHDERVVRQVRSGEGSLVDSQDDVGGYPALDENHEPLDVPTRNLRAWLRELAREVEP